MSAPTGLARSIGRGDLTRFRDELLRSLTARADAPFELTDAVLCADGPVRSLVDLTRVAERRRGHGAMYDALRHGRVDRNGSVARWRRCLSPGGTGGSCSPSMSLHGCARMPRPARSGCSATSTAEEWPRPAHPGLALLLRRSPRTRATSRPGGRPPGSKNSHRAPRVTRRETGRTDTSPSKTDKPIG